MGEERINSPPHNFPSFEPACQQAGRRAEEELRRSVKLLRGCPKSRHSE